MSTDVSCPSHREQLSAADAAVAVKTQAQPKAVSLEELLALKRYEQPQASAWDAFDAAWEKRCLRAILKSQRPWVRWARSLKKRLYLWVPSAALAAASLFTVGQQTWQRLPLCKLADDAAQLPVYTDYKDIMAGRALPVMGAASPAQAQSLSAKGRGVCYVVATLAPSQGPNLTEGKYF